MLRIYKYNVNIFIRIRTHSLITKKQESLSNYIRAIFPMILNLILP